MRAIGLLIVTACAGKAPPNPAVSPDAPRIVDAAPVVTSQMLNGKAMDFFGGQAIASATLATDGLEPPQTTASGSDGSYSLQIAIGSKLFVIATKTSYRPTRNPAIAVDDVPVTQNLYAMTVQDVQNQYTGLGKTPVAGTAFLAIELLKHNGMPLTGIPTTGIQLLDAQNQPVTAGGVYFFNAQGALDTAATASVADGAGHARAAILDVPPGSYAVATTYPAGMGGNMQDNVTVTVTADGATYTPSTISSPGTGSGGTGSGGTGSGSAGSGSTTDPTFASDIYPLLQRAGAGGLGCANCHTANGPGAVLPYDDPPQTVLAHMTAITGVINTTTPAQSMFLTMPLYETTPPQNHPNATFLDANDPDYKLFMLWITNGAKP
jgi:hypothetical protein